MAYRMAYYSSSDEEVREVRVPVHAPLHEPSDDNDVSLFPTNEPGKLIVLKFSRLKHLLVPVRFRIITR